MKRISAIIAIALFSYAGIAQAAPWGFYLGAGAGRSKLLTPSSGLFAAPATNTKSQGGYTGRAFIGFNLTPFFGVEGSYQNYYRSVYNGRFAGLNSSVKYYVHNWQAVMKAYLPIGYSGFNLYALAGAARVTLTTKFIDSGLVYNPAYNPPVEGVTHSYRTRPMYGVGASYSFPPNLTLFIEVSQVMHLGSFHSNPYSIPAMNSATVNLAWGFC